eukprot:3676939-Rhodomonas_salina.2
MLIEPVDAEFARNTELIALESIENASVIVPADAPIVIEILADSPSAASERHATVVVEIQSDASHAVEPAIAATV